METLTTDSGDDRRDSHYHDASQHGLGWAILNELLHIIVLIYTLSGMIQFRVKFIKMANLVRWASRLIIAYSTYMSIKFAVLSFLLYIFNLRLQKKSIQISELNCSLSNYEKLEAKDYMNSKSQNYSSIFTLPLDYLPDLSEFLDTFGGPYRLLGNRATILYGVYSIAIYIMLVIFPLELMYSIDVGFNFIRFVLSDPSCMEDLYEKRDRHLARLSSWSRNQADSLLTKGAKICLKQMDLRSADAYKYIRQGESIVGEDYPTLNCSLLNDAYHLEMFPENPISDEDSLVGDDPRVDRRPNEQQQQTRQWHARLWHLPQSLGAVLRNRTKTHLTPTSSSRFSQMIQMDSGHPNSNIKQLRTRLAINHHDRPSYQVCVANRNLKRFKPFVRSYVWFKASMILYPLFIIYYFIMISFSLGFVEYFSLTSLWDTIVACKLNRQQDHHSNSHATNTTTNSERLDSDWSFLDRLIYYENIYAVFLLSCASSFYCSYYFGTIIELAVWIRELLQQLELSAHLIELTDILTHSSNMNPIQVRRKLVLASLKSDNTHYYVNDFGGWNEIFPFMRDLKQGLLWQSGDSNQFGRPCGKYRMREKMAFRLLTKRETVLRATYLNLCLFFDELHGTRTMTTIILRRTAQICAGFALMSCVTRSQFNLNSGDNWHHTLLLLSTLAVFNLYLACAAFINSGVDKILVKIHSLIASMQRTGSTDADLFEFWLRNLRLFGEEKDVTAYSFYGLKITWSRILKINSSIFTLYNMSSDIT